MPKHRRSSRKGVSKKTVKAIVAKEVGKTRELQKMVSYVGWSKMNDLLVSAGGTEAEEICVFSLTGGLNPLLDNTQNPQNYQCKNLFTLLPSDNSSASTTAGVGQAGQGGTANQMDGVGGNSGAIAIAEGIHQLEGRSAYLKNFYATIGLNNATTGVEDPTNMYIRCMVIETRRPLSSKSLSQQILCQNHAVPAMNSGVPASAYPVSAFGYVNRDVVKRILFNKLINLNAGAGATGSMRSFKIKLRLNKKIHWSYYYNTRDPVPGTVNTLTYQGGFYYLVMWPSSTPVQGAAWDSSGISALRQPRFALNSLLTFYDD